MARPTTLPEPWRSLALRLGGVQALADALHASARSVHHWAHGARKPSRQAQALIDQVQGWMDHDASVVAELKKKEP